MKYKKLISFILLIFLVSCSKKTFLVEYIVDGEVYHQEKVSADNKLEKPLEPTKAGYEFVGWYNDEELWVFSVEIIKEDLTLTARWEKNVINVEKSSRTYLKNTQNEFTIYKFETNIAGPTIFIIGGIHGDERAGWKAALKMLEYDFFRGTVYVLPEANNKAINSNPPVRQVGQNLNRVFPGKVNGTDVEVVAYHIYEAIKSVKPDLVLDLHESRGSYKDGYLGDTIINNVDLYSLYLSSVISELKKLDLLKNNPTFSKESSPPKGSINKEVSERENIPVFTIETNRGNFKGTINDETIPLEKRISIQLAIVDLILKTFEPIN